MASENTSFCPPPALALERNSVFFPGRSQSSSAFPCQGNQSRSPREFSVLYHDALLGLENQCSLREVQTGLALPSTSCRVLWPTVPPHCQKSLHSACPLCFGWRRTGQQKPCSLLCSTQLKSRVSI